MYELFRYFERILTLCGIYYILDYVGKEIKALLYWRYIITSPVFWKSLNRVWLILTLLLINIWMNRISYLFPH